MFYSPLLEIPNHPLCPVIALKLVFLLSSDEQGSDPVFIFTTLLGTKPLTYGKFTKDLKGLLKRLVLGTAYSSHSFMLQIGIGSVMIKLMGYWSNINIC